MSQNRESNFRQPFVAAAPGRRSALGALTWEIWQRGSRLGWMVIGITALCGVVAWSVPNKRHFADSFEAVYWFLMVCSMILTFGIFHHAEYVRGKSWHGFPYRHFLLPVPTVVLVACPMILGLCSVELVYWVWAKLVFAPLGRVVILWPALVIGVGLLFYQATIWSLAGFRVTRLLVLAFMGLALMNFGMVPFILVVSGQRKETVFPVTALLLALMGLAACCGAWYSVEQQRHGGGRGKGVLKAIASHLMDLLPRRRKPFASASGAQFWYEWRQGGVVLPLCVGGLLLLAFTPLSWLMCSDHDSVLWVSGWALALPLLLGAFIGKEFAKPTLWSRDVSLNPFLAVRPIPAGELVVTRMKVAAASVTVAWFCSLLFLALYYALWADTSQLRECWDSLLQIYPRRSLYAMAGLSLVLAPIVTWRMMIVGWWAGFSGDRRLFAASLIGQLAALILLIWGAVWFCRLFWTHLEQLLHHTTAIGLVLVGLAALKLALARWSWRGIRPRRAAQYLLIWWICTLGFIAQVWLVNPPLPALKQLFLLAALLVFPLARVGIAPFFLEKNRHR
jgi:hypothetical protein